MSGLEIVTFTSDFGAVGGYVAACEAVLSRVAPRARVIHISHDVPPGDVAAASLTLQRVAPFCPCAVHLAVVDPGVGTTRRPVAVSSARGDILVGPDNGLLPPAADALGGALSAWLLDPAAVRNKGGLVSEGLSYTFHGRDLFAPAAGVIAAGTDPGTLGRQIDPLGLERLVPPQIEISSGVAVAEVIEVDRFGNIGLALPFGPFVASGQVFSVEVPGEDLPAWTARVVRTYGELESGELGLYRDSWGQAALALNGASAAELLSLGRGMKVRLRPTPKSDGDAPRK